MTAEIKYATICKAIIFDTKGNLWEFQTEFFNLKDALDWATVAIDEDAIAIRSKDITMIQIMEVNTGKVLAECTHDENSISDSPSDEEDFLDWDEEENPEYDPYLDWGYNEDIGYDPYLGCCTDDC